MTRPEQSEESELARLLRAAHFSAVKHRAQRRKGSEADPYINHPLHVASLLAGAGGTDDINVLIAALLHDAVEDTDATLDEIRENFGDAVAKLVAEVSDDKSLPKHERKALQVEHAAAISREAQSIKLADKISNVRDMYANPPMWSKERKQEYMDWSEQVVGGMRGANPRLEEFFDSTMLRARKAVDATPDDNAA